MSRVISLKYYQSHKTKSACPSTNRLRQHAKIQTKLFKRLQDKSVLKFLLLYNTVTLNECQGHWNWCKTVEFFGVYHPSHLSSYKAWKISICKCCNISQHYFYQLNRHFCDGSCAALAPPFSLVDADHVRWLYALIQALRSSNLH